MKQTIVICLTAFAIATEYLMVDMAKFKARAEMIDQAARALRDFHQPQAATPRLEHL
jgi:hypothetical protein